MKFKFEKTIRIVNDLLSYCHGKGANDYGITIHQEPGLSRFKIHCAVDNLDPGEIKRVEDTLNVSRHYEMEQNYWGLTGEFESDSDLQLTGMMIDEAEVAYEEGILSIEVRRFEK